MTSDNSVDRLYANRRDAIEAFNFDDKVARVFPDMIKRSVPGYSTIIGMIGVLAEYYAQPDTTIYDLGCSLGAATFSMRWRIKQPGCRIIAVDNSLPMLERARQHLEMDAASVPVDLVCADIRDIAIADASVVVLNFTLQFIAAEKRGEIIRKIREGMREGGILILSEKIEASNPASNDWFIETHHAFKRANGYSDLEISQKRSALENVLIPETIETHIDRLRKAGFQHVEHWFQCLNFCSFIAIK